MKKYTVPIIIAVVLIIGAIVAAVLLNRTSSESPEPDKENNRPFLTEEEVDSLPVEVKTGKYYPGGDKNSDLWLEVDPEFIRLKGIDNDEAIRKAVIESGTGDEESLRSRIESIKTMYSTEKYYLIESCPLENTYQLIISRDGNGVSRENLKTARKTAALLFNTAENSIKIGSLGDFILVE